MRRLVLACLLGSCIPSTADDPDAAPPATADALPDLAPPPRVIRPADWAEPSHGKASAPNYQLVFPNRKVNRLDIVIAAADWQRMLDDLTSRLSAGTPLELVRGTPIYVPCEVTFETRRWTFVGIRFKGNSTLFFPFMEKKGKLPFRLDFDEFENDHPEIADQRFFGFKALSLGNNARDASLLRDKVGADLYRQAGVPTPRVAFYRVFVDFGRGSTYFGLYTVAEVPGRALIDAQLGGGGGNLYKADGPGARLATFDAASFEKKTNEAANDFTDVMRFMAALGSPRSDAPAWRARLEKTFDVDGFLRWLPVTTVAPNWDVYGAYPHNYFLYGDPASGGQLRWIQWDNNEAFKPEARAIKIDLASLPPNWPLLNHVATDPVYRATYVRHLRTFVETVFVPQMLRARLQAEHDLIAPHVIGPGGELPGYSLLPSTNAFTSAVRTMFTHVDEQSRMARQFLSAQ